MRFASPLWLTGFLPWTLLALWLLLHQRETTNVPFLALWKNASIHAATRPRLGLPPLPLILLLLAIASSLLGAAGPRLAQAVEPLRTTATPQAAITLLSASDRPHPQVLVQITTVQCDRPTLELVVTSGAERVVQSTAVGSSGSQTTLIDLKSLSGKVNASINDSATVSIQRSGQPIAITADAHAPAALRRLIELIQRQHDASPENAVTIAIDSSLPTDRPGIVLAPPSSSAPSQWTVMDDPLTRDVDWSELTGGCAVDSTWEPLVFSGNRVLLARRKQMPLQILSSVATIDWASRPSFVVFWTHAIETLAGGNGDFASYQSRLILPETPPMLPIPRDLSPVLFLAALAALALAGLFVPEQSIPYTARHVEPSAAASEQAAHSHR